MPEAFRGRDDARAKASGATRYVGDVSLPGMLHVALVRSLVPHARIAGIDTKLAEAADGVAGVFTAADVCPAPYGRSVRDIPILARGKVRFAGERVAAVVGESRRAAEAAAALVEVTYDDMSAVLSAADALAPDAPAVHDEPWNYPRAAVRAGDGRNVQSRVTHGSPEAVAAALAESDHVIDRTYSTPSGHQGYLEPQACVAAPDDGRLRIWATNKSPYRLRSQLAECLGLDPASIEIQPGPLGGDFGGKGSPMDIPLCAELARLTGRPVKLVLRYTEELTATNPRHPARIRVQAGCRDGRLTAVAIRAVFNGGAYAGFKPLATVSLHGIDECAMAYHVPAQYLETVIAYTNTVPRGHMRSPASPQAAFALESALDELADLAGLEAAEFRRRNLVRPGTPSVTGKVWAEARGVPTLDAAVGQARLSQAQAPPGWRRGTGLALYAREAPGMAATSIRLLPLAGGRIRAEVPVPETGTGSHTVVRNLLAAGLGVSPADVEVVHVGTGDLPGDPGVGASRVTVGMSEALDRAVRAWRERGDPGEPVGVRSGPDAAGSSPPPVVSSYCAQVAQVAVDPATGQVRVLEILTAVDVGRVVHPAGHQMQIDGGTVMGYGFACTEDLAEYEGQVTAASLGEFRLPTAADTPVLRTVLVEGGQGVTSAGVKPVGELTNVPVAAAIANAVADATGCRIRDLPVTAEKVYWALREPGAAPGTEPGALGTATGGEGRT